MPSPKTVENWEQRYLNRSKKFKDRLEATGGVRARAGISQGQNGRQLHLLGLWGLSLGEQWEQRSNRV